MKVVVMVGVVVLWSRHGFITGRHGFAWTREAIRLNCFLSFPKRKERRRGSVML